MSTTMSSYVLIIDLGTGDEKPRVLRRFDHHRLRDSIIRDRIVKGRKDDGDVEMGEASDDVEEDDEGSASAGDSSPALVNILRIAISPDGQWLATSDDRARTHIFNLDSVQVRTLPIHTSPFTV